ncbi:hypothetical protein HHL16_03155 [Pseudoflavitalea sp. G-6-1-2]|uniref:hypothetical protein n=1 Tax=Pseudoflavitalea sp. G-6-1-2 TaxID=2728841 RepID=UPI00146C5C23|nr:hypothetical protein [Pseudoflavitalea sp. G-6-1-2]NML19852.1 hypothetical protein [Pseudoflavitalea sp. G-6-1-2]
MENNSAIFKKLKQQHTILLLLLFFVLAGGIAYVSMAGAVSSNAELNRILQVVAVVDTIAGLVLGFNLFKKKLMQARNSDGSEALRLGMYHSACLLWWVMIFSPGLAAAVFFAITGDYSFVALAFVHLLILLAFMPRKDNIAVLLRLSAGSLD